MPRPSEWYDIELPKPDGIDLPIDGGPVTRPEMIDKLHDVSSATAAATLHRMGIRQTFMAGPKPRVPGAKVVGPAVTLQFMPQREDVASGKAQEHVEKRSALWSVFETVEPGDVLVVQAFGDPYTGTMGDMLTTYFKGRGGLGIVVDGSVRDWPENSRDGLAHLDQGLHTQLRFTDPPLPLGASTCPSPVVWSWSSPATSSSRTTTVRWWSRPSWPSSWWRRPASMKNGRSSAG